MTILTFDEFNSRPHRRGLPPCGGKKPALESSLGESVEIVSIKQNGDWYVLEDFTTFHRID
jgi:hypothetical protein